MIGINKIKNRIIKKISFHHTDGEMYGLELLFEFNDDSCLYFDFDTFYILNINLVPKLKWESVSYINIIDKITISIAREDEGQAYFLKFSNGDIFHVYQRVESLDYWEQDFEIVSKKENPEWYVEVEQHMSEAWIEDIIFEERNPEKTHHRPPQ